MFCNAYRLLFVYYLTLSYIFWLTIHSVQENMVCYTVNLQWLQGDNILNSHNNGVIQWYNGDCNDKSSVFHQQHITVSMYICI